MKAKGARQGEALQGAAEPRDRVRKRGRICPISLVTVQLVARVAGGEREGYQESSPCPHCLGFGQQSQLRVWLLGALLGLCSDQGGDAGEMTD